MKKSIRMLSLLVTVLLCLPILAACNVVVENKVNSGKETTLSRMTIDINPSVEFILDGNNKVVSATALNDDGAVILSGEAFVGMDADKAAELVVSLAVKNGYIAKASDTESGKKIAIGVTGDEKTVKDISDKVKEKIEKYASENSVGAYVEKAAPVSHEVLAALTAHCTAGLEKDEAMELDDQQLLALLNESRKETANILSEELREFYYKLRDSEYSFAESEAVNKLIGGMDETYKALEASRTEALKALRAAIDSLKKASNDNVFSPDSLYKKAYEALSIAKSEYVAEVKKVEALAEGTEKELAKKVLAVKKLALEAAENTLAQYEGNADALLENVVSVLESALEKLKKSNSELPEEVKTVLASHAGEIEDAMDQFKKDFYNEFEKEYKEIIENFNESIAKAKAK